MGSCPVQGHPAHDAGNDLIKISVQPNRLGTDGEQKIAFQAIFGSRVLLVEDNLTNQEIAVELLSVVGVKVTVASGGEEALELLDKEPPFDLVLMDIQMPGMDGYETTQMVRSDQRFARLPVVAMTAHVMSGDRKKSFAAGMQDYIPKPIDPTRLYATLLKWIVPHQGEKPLPEEGERSVGESLTDMPGIRVRRGLACLGGNEKMYRKLLCRFGRERRHMMEEVARHMAEEKWQEARILVHTAKGIAGSLGMDRLYKVGGEMEKALVIADLTSCEKVFPVINLAMEEVLQSISALICTEEMMISVIRGSQGREWVVSMLVEMLIFLEEDFGKVQNMLEQIQPWLQEEGHDKMLRQLTAAVDEFDTDQCRHVLDILLHSLESQPEV